MNLGYLFLAIAIVSEVTGSSLIKYTEGFTKPLPSIFCMTLFGFAIFMLSKTVNYIPLYIAYALWGGSWNHIGYADFNICDERIS